LIPVTRKVIIAIEQLTERRVVNVYPLQLKECTEDHILSYLPEAPDGHVPKRKSWQ
jgi:hypothetical protein